MTEAHMIEAVRVHIAGSDIPMTPRKDAGDGIHTTFQTETIANVIADGQPRLLLSHSPTRKCAILTFTSAVATDVVILAGSMSDAQTGVGMRVPVLTTPLELHSTDEVWLGAFAGNGMAVGVAAEYA